MGLLHKLGSLVEKPMPLDVADDPQTVLAPVSGQVVALEDLADPVFAQGMLGVGMGMRPEGDVAYSPVTGTVAADVKTKHALLIRAQSGAEVLLHVGLDTVELRGAGFHPFVRKGDAVRAGDPVLGFDRALIEGRGLDDTVVVTVSNPEAFAEVEPACGEKVVAGELLLRCVGR